MKFNNWREFVFFLMFLSSILWFILTFIEMMFYSGGTMVNPNSPGYDFFSNFHSDLGRTVSYSGRPNTISYVIFTINNTIFWGSAILFFVAVNNFFREKTKEKWIALVGTIIGVFTCIIFLIVIFLPWDLYYEPHVMLNRIGSLALILVVVLFAVATYLNEDYPNRYFLAYLIYTIIVVIYLVVMFTGPSITSAEGLRIQATWQKILLFAGIITILFQGYGAWKLERSNTSKI